MKASSSTRITTIDEYLRAVPADVRAVLAEVRATIRQAAPGATEKISYGMPTFHDGRNLVHFAACKNHVGFYPTPSGIAAFAPELARYKTSKGAVQFPLDRPMPLALIARIVKHRVAENAGGARRKAGASSWPIANPDVDTYIANAPAFAQPILTRIRAAFHAGCPELEERLKWGVPSFEHKGMLGGMAAFKAHVALGFWKSRLMEDFDTTFGVAPAASPMRVHIRTLADLPPKKVLVAYVKEAKRLNDEGIKETKRAAAPGARAVVAPADFTRALAANPRAQAIFASFTPSQRRNYIEWIASAKRETTRAERVATAVAWLAEGKRRNWKYERRG